MPEVLRSAHAFARVYLGNVTLIDGRARFVDSHEVEIEGIGGRFRCERIIVATGARTYVPEAPGLDEVPYWTNREALQAEEPPGSLVIWGAGARSSPRSSPGRAPASRCWPVGRGS